MAVIYLLNTYDLDVRSDLITLVESNRQLKINKTSSIQKKQELLGAGLLLKETLENHFITEYEIIYNEHHKPFLKDLPYYYSITHSNGIVCLCLDKEELGIDIQLIKPVKESLILKVLNEEELKLYQTLDKQTKLDYFYEVWCAKEALSKRLGTGITYNLKDIEITDVTLKKIKIYNDYYMLAKTSSEPFKLIERNISKEYKTRRNK